MRSVRFADDTILFLHDSGEALSDVIIRQGDYWEKDILEYLAFNHKQQEVIIDVGANIGNHSIYFSKYLNNYKIYAFEPVFDNYDLLVKNIEENNANVVPICAAVGDTHGPVKVTPNRGNMGASEVSSEGSQETYQMSLDKINFIKKITLIKIDAEWYEPQVLVGANDTIQRDNPLILIEDATGDRIPHLLMGSYVIEKAWPHHKTYLYRSLND